MKIIEHYSNKKEVTEALKKLNIDPFILIMNIKKNTITYIKTTTLENNTQTKEEREENNRI
jgi:hypothetical protein